MHMEIEAEVAEVYTINCMVGTHCALLRPDTGRLPGKGNFCCQQSLSSAFASRVSKSSDMSRNDIFAQLKKSACIVDIEGSLP